MELQITGVHTELSPQTREYIERKLEKLSRHLPGILEVKVEITREQTRSPRQRFIAQITLHAGGAVLRAEERSVDLQNAIDRVAAVIDRQIARFKGKSHDKTRGTSVARTPQTPPKAVDTKKLIRRKRLTVKPMTVNQAIDAMELVGHDFYLFQDSDGEAVNLVYRRQDGNYGLIESQADEE